MMRSHDSDQSRPSDLPEPLATTYSAAANKWVGVDWVRAAYQLHLERVDGDAENEGLFLTGAAGFRDERAWSYIDEFFRDSVLRIVGKIIVPGISTEDIWQQTLAKLAMDSGFDTSGFPELGYAKTPCRIVEFRGLNRRGDRSTLGTYLTACAKYRALSERERAVARVAEPQYVILDKDFESAEQFKPSDLFLEPGSKEKFVTDITVVLVSHSPAKRLFFRMVEFDQAPMQATAEDLGLVEPGSPPYVASRLFRGMWLRIMQAAVSSLCGGESENLSEGMHELSDALENTENRGEFYTVLFSILQAIEDEGSDPVEGAI